ncbi:glutamine amidotransferase [Fuerstiella marisgermanici]|uniref:Putative membrane protein n=1 Tax=Fuerstiella marisgermanici TaxID=1891926 RepID=A0A1P8WHD4_9PLAN|nr:glutamine amidotransferase [Fuerstiella marisgermanici]APZ93462.1 putative membrane protein [Fuerstiella marisgermanici]
MKLAFEPVWPWPLILLTCVALLGVVAIGYPRRVRHLPKTWQRILMGLRVALVLLISLWLLRPAIVLESDENSDAVLYVVLDASGSMNTPDAPGGISRRQSLLQLFDEAKPLLDELGESVEIRIRELAEDLTPVESPSATSDGELTAIGANLEELAKEADRENIAAILFWGDGKQAALGRDNIDPIQPARLLGRQHRPVYTVSYGSSEIAATSLDVALSELDIARDVYEGNRVPIRVRFKAFGAEGRDVQLKVYQEDRTGLPNGKSGPMREIPLSADNLTLKTITPRDKAEDTTIDLYFVPSQSGEIKIAVEAIPLNDEVRRTNNRVEAIIRVRSGGIRVAYFDRLRPEFKWLKRITVSSRVQLDAKWVRGGEFSNRNDFNEDWFVPGNYDAFIIGDVPASVFGEERLRKLYACCEAGAGLMMIGGQQSFGPGGYGSTPLAALMPVAMSPSDQQLTDNIPMVPTEAGERHSILQIAPPEQNRSRWSELPPLEGANVLRLKEGTVAQTFAESKSKMPLLVGQSTGAGRVLAFAGDTTWQWALRDDWAVEAHQRFWRQVIFWLTKMENDGETPAWINVEPRDMNPGGLAELTFGLRDEDGLPLANVNYSVNVQRPDDENEVVTVRAEGGHGAGEYQNTALPGDYWATVAAEGSDGLLNYASTRFLVSQRDPELDNPAADPALMRELAHVSGGDYLDPDGMIARLEDWVDNGMPSLKLKRSRRVTLWDNWFSLLLFVLLLTLEWVFRKKRGLV